MLPTRDSLQGERQTEGKVREWIFHANENDKNVGKQYAYQTKCTLKQRSFF